MKRKNSKNGITLIALIITVIVLLILAGVSISLVLGDNGVVTKAQTASNETKETDAKELIGIAWGSCEMEYQDAWANDQSVKRNIYFTKEKMNSYLGTNGEIAEDFIYIENTTTMVKYKEDDNEYFFFIDKNGKVTNAEITVKINGKEEKITIQEEGKYLGRTVSYTPANKETNTSYGTSEIYRLFYIDWENKYGDGAGTIYLKADCDDKNKNLRNSMNYGSTDGYTVMKKLNPDWAKTNPDTNNLQINERNVAWILDPNVWKNWKDSSLEESINYVVGSPSLELYIDSYNKYIEYHKGLYKNDSTTDLAETLACEYTTDTDTYAYKGYRMGFFNKEWANTGYYQNANSLIKSEGNQVMYNPGTSSRVWLGSISSYGGNRVCVLDGYISALHYGYYENSRALCPVVSLNSGVILNIASN